MQQVYKDLHIQIIDTLFDKPRSAELVTNSSREELIRSQNFPAQLYINISEWPKEKHP